MKIDYVKLKDKDIYLKDKIYDFIIIGSGPAAVTLYRKLLSKKKKNILILEEGDYSKKSFKKVLTKHLKIKLRSRAFTVGGTSSIWSNVSSYLEDFEMKPRWKNRQLNLWPLSHEILLKEYKKLDKKYQFSFNKLKSCFLNIPFEVRPFIASTKPINFKQLINENEVDLIYNCKISTIDENQKIATAFNQKNKFKFKAKKIIICCGGIESVNLIQNSLYKKKLKNIKNKNIVGKYFMDHPKFNLGYLKYPKLDIINKLELKIKKNLISYYGISLKRNIQQKKNLLNSYVRFEKLDNRISRFFEKLNIPIIKNIRRSENIYKVRLFCEMMPNIKNSIVLKQNKIFVNFKLSKIDHETIKLLSNKIKNFFSFKPDLETNFKVQYEENKIKDASHHIGGLRFDNNKKLSVVDKSLKIRGLKNIYVCSSAIFPTSGSVNPTMTICALSGRLGEHLKNNI